MDNEHRELLSALMDGEISDLELRRLLKHGDEHVERDWARLHTVQRVLKDGNAPFAGLDVSTGVSAAIDEMPAYRAPRSNWLQPVAGLAIAASVAAVVVLTGGNFPASEAARPEVAAAALPTRVVPPGAGSAATGGVAANASAGSTQSVVPDRAARERFRQHMLRHTQRAVDNSGYGVFSYARVVYEVKE